MKYSHCVSIIISTTSDIPAELLAVQLYDPDIFLFIFGTVNLDPLWSTVPGLSVLYHAHVILELGLAAVTLHSNAAVCPSIIPYGLEVVKVTSGLSIIDMISSTGISVHL